MSLLSADACATTSSEHTTSEPKEGPSAVAYFGPIAAVVIWTNLEINHARHAISQYREALEETRKLDAARAEGDWDLYRMDEILDLAERLKKSPQRTLNKLEQSVYGCRWLADQYSRLAEILRTVGHWTPQQYLHSQVLWGSDKPYQMSETLEQLQAWSLERKETHIDCLEGQAADLRAKSECPWRHRQEEARRALAIKGHDHIRSVGVRELERVLRAEIRHLDRVETRLAGLTVLAKVQPNATATFAASKSHATTPIPPLTPIVAETAPVASPAAPVTEARPVSTDHDAREIEPVSGLCALAETEEELEESAAGAFMKDVARQFQVEEVGKSKSQERKLRHQAMVIARKKASAAR